MPSVPPAQGKLVRIDKTVDRNRLQHLKRAVRPDPPRYPNGRITLNDLAEFSEWLKREDYAFEGKGWFDRFPDGAAAVGHGVKFESLLASDMSATGFDLAYIRTELQAGRLKKPETKIGSEEITDPLFGPEDK